MRAVRVSTALAAQGAAFDVSPAGTGSADSTHSTDGATSLIIWATSGEVNAMRVGATAVLDTAPVLLSTAASRQAAPALAFDGTNVLVVWEDVRIGTGSDISAARVSPGGTVLDLLTIAVANTPDLEREPTVAFDGTNCLVAWGTYSGGIGAQRISPNGQPIGAPFSLVGPGTASKNAPAAAFDGTNFQVSWVYGAGDDIHLKRVSPSGAVLDSSVVPVTSAGGYDYSPSIACDGIMPVVGRTPTAT